LPPVRPVPPTGASVRLSGVVGEGVEAGCLVLRSGGTTFLLLGAPADVRPGDQVTVRGKVRQSMATTCQQGVPFRVEEVQRP
jgi:hypothetical protein